MKKKRKEKRIKKRKEKRKWLGIDRECNKRPTETTRTSEVFE